MSRNYSQVASPDAIERAQAALETNGFKVERVETLRQAHDMVLEMIPEGSEVFTGTSVTLEKTGLAQELNESGKYISVRQLFMSLAGQEDKAVEMRRIGSGADYALGSVHAITEDGQAVIASASGSQLPGFVYGASHVIWVVGTQKVVTDLNEAFDRLENYTFPLEDKRALKAYGGHSTISKILIYRKETRSRVTVIFVNEAVGF